MKLRSTTRLAFPLASAIAALLAAQSANAATYYWDNNTTTAGLSTGAGTSGTWNGATNVSNTYAAVPQGNLNGTATLNATGLATTTSDSIYFGTNNLSLGATASTIGTTGAISINNIVIGTGQTNPFTLSAGATITLGGTTPTVTVNTTSATATIDAIVAGSAVVKAGAGTLILTNDSNSFNGGVTIAGGGTLQVGNGTSGILVSQALTFNSGGGTINFNEAAGSTQNMGALTFSAGFGAVQSTYAGSGNSTLAFSTSTTRTAGATGNFVVLNGTNGTTNKITLTGPASNAFIDKGLFFGGSRYAYYDSAGYVREMKYDGLDTDTEFSDTITASKHVQLTTSPAARAGDTLLSLNLSGGGVDYTMNSGSLTVPAILKSGDGAVSTISGGTSLTTDSNAELVIRTDTASDLLTISSAVTGFSGGLTKTGAGTLTLSSTNGYAGTTNINAGTLVVSGGSAIADGVAVNLANSSGATFQLNSSETIGSLSGGGFSGGDVNVGASTLTLAGTSTFGGKLIGTGGVTVSAGTLTLSNKNTFAGTITLNGTSQLTLSYGNDGTTSTPTASSGGAISMAGGTSLLMNPTAQVAAGFAQGGQGGAVAFGNFYSNPIIVSSGTASIKQGPGGVRYVSSGGVTGGTSGAQTLSILQGASGGNAERTTITVSGIIQDGSGGTLGVSADFLSASSTSQGAFICLSGQNTFTGPIVVSNTKGLKYTPGVGNPYLGAWFVIGGEITSGFSDRTVTTGSGSLGTTAPGSGNYSGTISLATGTILNYMSSANQILGGAISGTGNIVKEGSGTLTLTSGSSNYTGSTLITTGILNANSTATLGSGTATNTLIFNGGTLQAGGTITSPSTRGVTMTGAGTIDTNGNAVTIDGIVSGAGALTKSGANTLTLSNANTYTGATSVNAGTLTLSGNRTANTTGGYNLNTAGTATLNIQNGTYGIGGTFIVGALGGNATVNHSAGTISSVGGSGLIMGNGTSTSNYNLSGGALTISTANGFIMGTNSGTSSAAPSVSTITVSGTGALTVSTLRIGRYDNGQINTTNTFTQTGGTTTITTLGMGGGTGNAQTGPTIATLNLTGGIFSATNFTALSQGGAATVPNAQSSFITIGGTAQVTLGAIPTARGTNSTATITFDTTAGGGGFLAPVAASTTYMPAGTFTNAYLTANGANFNVPTLKDITIGQALKDAVSPAAAGTLTKSGVGTLTLAGANTYSGNTIVSDGTLILADDAQLRFVLGAISNSNNSLTGAGTVTLNGDFVIDTTAADALASGTWTLENVSTLTGAYGSTFIVVGFVNAGSDKWTKDIGGKVYTFDETTGILTLAASGSAYDTWKAANAPGSNPGDDTDVDGVTNAVEFVLGGTSATNDLDKLPAVSTSGGNLIFTFQRDVDSIDAKTALFIETSTDLVTWNTAPSPYTVPDGAVANNPGVTVVEDTPAGFDTVTLTVPQTPDAKKFARLKVVITP